tara:strand:- start:225 stop:851 length:627 start_codon:yes stop_codon:yes gene_type:complete
MIRFPNLKAHLLFSFILTISLLSYSQEDTKYEFEKRINKEDFPTQSIELLQPFLKHSKNEKYYREFDGSNYFYELKLLFKSKNLSIKFTNEGDLVDIESLYDFEELSNNIKKTIIDYLDNSYKRSKIRKTQIQYNREVEDDGESEDDIEFVEDFLEKDDDLIIRYELEVEVMQKETNSAEFFEFIFNEKGELLEKRKIIQRDDDIILY